MRLCSVIVPEGIGLLERIIQLTAAYYTENAVFDAASIALRLIP